MANIKRNDTVLVISGKDKGKRGAVVEVRPREHRVVVGGINQMKRHVRPRQELLVRLVQSARGYLGLCPRSG